MVLPFWQWKSLNNDFPKRQRIPWKLWGKHISLTIQQINPPLPSSRLVSLSAQSTTRLVFRPPLPPRGSSLCDSSPLHRHRIHFCFISVFISLCFICSTESVRHKPSFSFQAWMGGRLCSTPGSFRSFLFCGPNPDVSGRNLLISFPSDTRYLLPFLQGSQMIVRYKYMYREMVRLGGGLCDQNSNEHIVHSKQSHSKWWLEPKKGHGLNRFTVFSVAFILDIPPTPLLLVSNHMFSTGDSTQMGPQTCIEVYGQCSTACFINPLLTTSTLFLYCEALNGGLP